MKLSKLLKLPLTQLAFYVILVAVILSLFFSSAKPGLWSQAGRDTFIDTVNVNKKFDVEFTSMGGDINTTIPGQMTVAGNNNQIGGTWLPHNDGNIYLRAGSTTDASKSQGRIYVGDTSTKSTEIGASRETEYNRIGEHTWLPFKDGHTYIRPGKENKDVLIGDWWTGGTRLGTGDAVKFNHIGKHTWLPYVDGNAYIRPNRDGGNISVGDMWTNHVVLGSGNRPHGRTNVLMRGRLHFNDDINENDPYYMEKVKHRDNSSSLRMTINDDADETFDVFGNSCGAGDCGGPGKAAHRFRAEGTAIHSNKICIGEIDGNNPGSDNGAVCIDKESLRKLRDRAAQL